jgi:hypothetical protein
MAVTDTVSGLFEPSSKDREAYAKQSLVILTPCKDFEVPARFAKSVANLVAYSWLHGLRIYQMGMTERMVVHWARNDLARKVRTHVNEYTGELFSHVLWLDDDSIFNPDLAVYLSRAPELDVVSALYFGRGTRNLPVVYVKDNTDDPYKHFPLIEMPSKLCEVDAIGLGACLMRRDVLDRMPEPWFSFQDAGEDIYFCVHAKRAGMHIYCDGSYMLGHLDEPRIVTHATYRQYLDANKDELADRIKVPLGGNGQWPTQFSKPVN